MAIEESTDFEWLDRPFMMTRIWVTLVAMFFLGLCAYEMIYILMFVPLGPPPPLRCSVGPEEAERVKPTQCWGERRPLGELGAMAGISILHASILILVWRHPRIGFALAAFGGLPVWAAGAFLPAVWLGFASWKVGRPTSWPVGGASLP